MIRHRSGVSTIILSSAMAKPRGFGRAVLAVVPVLLLLFCGGLVAQDDLADYPIKEEQCENFGYVRSRELALNPRNRAKSAHHVV